MKLAIEHTAVYRYDAPVAHTIQKLRLTPRSDGRQRIMDWELELPGHADGQLDAFGNYTHLLRLEKPEQEIRIHVHGVVETLGSDELTLDELVLEEPISPLVFLRPTALTATSEPMRNFALPYAADIHNDREAGLHRLMAAIAARQGHHNGDDFAISAADAFSAGAGQAHDHAHVFLALCRHFKIPARYVSGYLLAPEADSSKIASHAWAEAWIHDAGWVGFDVANQRRVGRHYLRLAIGMDYLDACPIRGLRAGGGLETLDIALEVQQVGQ